MEPAGSADDDLPEEPEAEQEEPLLPVGPGHVPPPLYLRQQRRRAFDGPGHELGE